MSLGRVTIPMALVIDALLTQTDDEVHGYTLTKTINLSAGTVYPILQRLETAGWVTSRWDNAARTPGGRAARRYYRIVDTHREEANQLVADRLSPHRKVGRDV